MKHEAKMKKALYLTFITSNGKRDTRAFCHPFGAAVHYAMMSAQDWWREKGHLEPDLMRGKLRLAKREEKIMRRVLPIFENALK